MGGNQNMLEIESPRADSHVSLADKLVFGKIGGPLCKNVDHLLQPLPPSPGMWCDSVTNWNHNGWKFGLVTRG